MPARQRYAPVLAAPTSLDDFDTAISAVHTDRLGDRISAGEAVALEGEIRHQREEWIMRTGG